MKHNSTLGVRYHTIIVTLARFGLVVFAACLFSGRDVSAQKPVLRKLDDTTYAAFSARRGPHLDVRTENADQLLDLLKVYTGKLGEQNFSLKSSRIVRVNAKRALIPFEQLSPGFQKNYIACLWPKDRLAGGTWRHRVGYSFETLWTLSQIFTGKGQNYRQIIRASGLKSDKIGKGTAVKIPADLLRDILKETEVTFAKPKDPVFAQQTQLTIEEEVQASDPVPTVSPPAKAKPDTPSESKKEPEKKKKKQDQTSRPTAVEQPRSASRPSGKLPDEVVAGRRELSHDRRGEARYAVYRLKAGEAIYSSVVVRFCGLVRANDVNRVAREIIGFNKIKDETDLPVGFPIKIPYERLEDEFKAVDDPDYLNYVRNLEDVSKVSTTVVARNLENVYLILDSGHGGMDPGAHFKSVWEDDYVYDIVCRVKARLERETAATVLPTIIDPSIRYKVQNTTRFKKDHDEVLLTRPRYSLNNRRVSIDGVNLRWILANHHYHELTKSGVKPENILFASFHADSLHRSIRGMMLYIPDARKYPGRVNPHGRYNRFKEYKTSKFRFTQKDMVKAQALSMSFARNYVASAKRNGIRVHRQKPVRSLIFRTPTTPFVPAVLKYNRVPTRTLVEVCNLNNAKDRAELKKPSFRQKVADAFVEAVYKTYGVSKVNLVRKSTGSAAASPER